MTKHEWNNVVRPVLIGLWPTMQLTGEQANSWLTAFSRVDGDRVVEAIRQHAIESDRKALPCHVAAILRRWDGSTAAIDSAADSAAEAAERQRIDAAWRDLEATIDAMSDADLDAHRLRVVALNPKLKFLLRSDRRSRLVAVYIEDRIEAGVFPDEDAGFRYETVGSELRRTIERISAEQLQLAMSSRPAVGPLVEEIQRATA